VNYFYLVAAAAAAAHAFLFGRWLITNGNKPGAYFVYIAAATCLALPVYRILAAP